MGGSSCSPASGEEVTEWHHFQARSSCMTLNKSGSHSASEMVMLTTKLLRFMILFWLRNALCMKYYLPTDLEESLPSRIWELQRARRMRRGNGRKWGSLDNRKTICRYLSCYKLLCPKDTWETCLPKTGHNLKSIEVEYVVWVCICVCTWQGRFCNHLVQFSCSMGQQEEYKHSYNFLQLSRAQLCAEGVPFLLLGIVCIISLWTDTLYFPTFKPKDSSNNRHQSVRKNGCMYTMHLELIYHMEKYLSYFL